MQAPTMLLSGQKKQLFIFVLILTIDNIKCSVHKRQRTGLWTGPLRGNGTMREEVEAPKEDIAESKADGEIPLFFGDYSDNADTSNGASGRETIDLTGETIDLTGETHISGMPNLKKDPTPETHDYPDALPALLVRSRTERMRLQPVKDAITEEEEKAGVWAKFRVPEEGKNQRRSISFYYYANLVIPRFETKTQKGAVSSEISHFHFYPGRREYTQVEITLPPRRMYNESFYTVTKEQFAKDWIDCIRKKEEVVLFRERELMREAAKVDTEIHSATADEIFENESIFREKKSTLMRKRLDLMKQKKKLQLYVNTKLEPFLIELGQSRLWYNGHNKQIMEEILKIIDS